MWNIAILILQSFRILVCIYSAFSLSRESALLRETHITWHSFASVCFLKLQHCIKQTESVNVRPYIKWRIFGIIWRNCIFLFVNHIVFVFTARGSKIQEIKVISKYQSLARKRNISAVHSFHMVHYSSFISVTHFYFDFFVSWGNMCIWYKYILVFVPRINRQTDLYSFVIIYIWCCEKYFLNESHMSSDILSGTVFEKYSKFLQATFL
jgi:hypothetical protein